MPYNRHYYLLAGESLDALNKMIEYDKLMTDFRMTDIRKEFSKLLGKEGPVEDPQELQGRLSMNFTEAQRRGYREKLGFNKPPVQVHEIGGGLLYRAYDVFPKIAMNPGTSKRNFGIGDLFADGSTLDPGGKRTAIYTSYEDYTGAHFAPPGAIKLTEQEFAAYDAVSREFEYYRTYDEGAEIPAGFDPAKHQVIKSEGLDSYLQFNHAFMVTGESAEKLRAHSNHLYNWFMPYQDFRDKLMPPLLAQLAPVRLSAMVEDPAPDLPRRTVHFNISLNDWNAAKEGLQRAMTLEKFEELPMDGCKVWLSPKEDTPIGKQIAEAMKTVSLPQKSPVDFGFEERPSLENSAAFNAVETGFPYMKVERYEGGDVKLMAMRLPPNVTTVETPKDCAPMSLDDYRALAGTEENLPTHVFRIGGEVYDALTDYDARIGAHFKNLAAFEQEMLDLFRGVSPGCKFGEFRLRSYRTVGDTPRDLHVTVRYDDCEAAKALLAERFKVGHVGTGYGHHGDWVSICLVESEHSEAAKEMKNKIAEIGYEPGIPKLLDNAFEFLNKGGYDQMEVKHLQHLDLHVVLFTLPSFVTGVAAPEDCVPLTKQEYALLFSEYCDLSRNSPLPPRPAHLRHLPETEHMKARRMGVNELKKSKDGDGLPLHERTEFSWFKIR
jgi:hypothetical protein